MNHFEGSDQPNPKPRLEDLPRRKAVRRNPGPPAESVHEAPAALPLADLGPRRVVQPPLSPTEKTVLRLLLKGMTERHAAAQLGRSYNTVHVHTRNIYRKLGVNSRKMLFILAANHPELAGEDGPANAAA